MPDEPAALDELGHFVCGVAGEQEPVPRLHLVGKSHEGQGVTAEGCGDMETDRDLPPPGCRPTGLTRLRNTTSSATASGAGKGYRLTASRAGGRAGRRAVTHRPPGSSA